MQKSAAASIPSLPSTLDARAALVLTACCAIWGVGLVMVKFSNAGISPVMNAGLRSIAAGILVFAWARLRGVGLFERDGTLIAGTVCGIVFAGEFLALYAGLARTPVSRATVFLHVAPFVAAFGEHFLVPGHRLTGMKLFGLFAAFAGLAVAMGEGVFQLSTETLVGDLLCFTGGVLWGITTTIVRTTGLRQAPAEKTLLYQLVASAAVLPLASVALGEAGVFDLTPSVLAAFAYTAIAVVFIGYTTWFWLMRSYSAASLHAFTFLTPLFGVMAGHVILGEPLSPGLMLALVLVAAGIYLVNRPARAA